MKIPQTVANATIPKPDVPLVNARAAGNAAEAVYKTQAQAASSLNKTAQQIQNYLDVAYEKQQQMADSFQGLDLYAQASEEAQNKVTELENQHQQIMSSPDASLHLKDHSKNVKDALIEIRDKYIEKANNDNVKLFLTQRLSNLYLSQLGSANNFQDAQMAAYGQSVITSTLRQYQQQAITAKDDPDRPGFSTEADGIVMQANSVIDTVQKELGGLPPDKLAQIRSKFLDTVTYERARRMSDADPEAYAKARSIGAFANLDQVKLDRLDERNDNKRIELLKLQISLSEKEQARLEKETEKERQAQVDEVYSRVLSGKLSLAELETLRERRVVTGADYRRMRDEITNPAQGSDPSVVQSVAIKVYNGQLSPQAIMGMQGMSLSDKVSWASKANTIQNELVSKADTAIGKRFTQAKQLLIESFKTRGILESFDPKGQQIKNQALERLMYDTKPFNPNGEDPLEYTRTKIIPEMTPLLQDRQRQRLSREDTQHALRYKDVNDVIAHKSEMPEGDFQWQLKVARDKQYWEEKAAEESAEKSRKQQEEQNKPGILNRLWQGIGGGEQKSNSEEAGPETGRPKARGSTTR
jgi:hypothetical protein